MSETCPHCRAAAAGADPDETRARYLRWVNRTIADRGWALQAVEGQPEDEYPDWCYTVGLTELGVPELVVFGLPSQTAGPLLNALGDRVAGGLRLQEGEVIDFDQWTHRVLVLPLPNAAQILHTAVDYYESLPGRPGPAVRAWQLVWDDLAGRFPWEPEYEPPGWLQPMPGAFRDLDA